MINAMSWTLPPKTILKTSPSHNEEEDMESAWQEAGQIEAKTDELGIPLNIEKIDLGPQVSLFRAIPAEKIAIRSLGKLSADIAYALGAESVSIQSPIAGEKYIGINVSRADSRRMVTLGDVL